MYDLSRSLITLSTLICRQRKIIRNSERPKLKKLLHLIRLPNIVCRKALTFTPEISFFLFDTGHLISQPAEQRPVKSIDMILCRTGQIHSNISPTPPLFFRRSKSTTFSTPVAFTARWFQNRAICRKPKTCGRSVDNLPKY